MGTRDPRVDAYIEKAADFAKPILEHIRAVVHEACPDVDETIKWSTPHFVHKGTLCMMAGFKRHAAFGFWKGSLVAGDAALNLAPNGEFGRLTRVSDLPPRKTLAAWVKKAAALNDAGIVKRKTPKRAPKPLVIPPALTAALKKNKNAQAAFAAFPPSHKREYAEWIAGAKTDETRNRRIAQAIDWIANGKSRNWKHERKI